MASHTVTGCIVTYNNMRTIDNAVSSVLENAKLPFKLYAVDNGSVDGTPEHIKETYPEVEIVKSAGNIGFGAGHNSVLDRLNSDYHAIINPDVIIRDDILTPMVEYMDAHPEVGMLSPAICFPDGRPQILGKRNPSIPYLVASRLRNEEKPCKALREYAMLDADLTKPTQIENATGCFMLIRTSLFREIGGFDKRYFMYFEDCDLTREVNKRSRCEYFPDAVVYHEWGRESKKDLHLMLVQVRSMISYFNKWGWK